MPLILTEMYPGSLFPGAFFSFVSYLFIAVLGNQVGYMVDKNERFFVVTVSLIVQNCMVALVGCLLGILSLMGNASPYETWTSGILFSIAVVFGGITTLSQAASDISIEKDWVIILSEEADLSSTNAMMRRINLICDVVCPMAFSGLMTFTSYLICATVISIWYVVSFFPEMALLSYLFVYEPKLAVPKKKPKTRDNFVMTLVIGWKLYYQNDIFFASFAYCLLFMIVLNPGVLFTIWLKAKNFGALEIGGFRSISALTGVFVTFFTPLLFSKIGVSKTALGAITIQLGCLIVGVAFVTVTDAVWAVYLLISLICIAKMGLFVFSLAELEIMQKGIVEEERGIVNATERSMQTLAYLTVMLLGVIANDPDNFWYLMIVNVDAYIIAWICFVIYYIYYRQTEGGVSKSNEEDLKEISISHKNDLADRLEVMEKQTDPIEESVVPPVEYPPAESTVDTFKFTPMGITILK
jgi:iron-regulated transporter 1